MNDLITVKYKGAELVIPYRVYEKVPPEFAINILPFNLKLKLYAKLTRHHDGYVREKYIKKLIKLDPALSIPYAIQLASEYIVEIIAVVFDSLSLFDKTSLKEYIEENQHYLNKSRDRMVSYWDCYYRLKFPELKTYKGFKLFSVFNELSPNKSRSQILGSDAPRRERKGERDTHFLPIK